MDWLHWLLIYLLIGFVLYWVIAEFLKPEEKPEEKVEWWWELAGILLWPLEFAFAGIGAIHRKPVEKSLN